MEEIAKKIYEKANELSEMISKAKMKDLHFAMVLRVPREDSDEEAIPNCIGILIGRPMETARLLNRLIVDTDMAKYLALDKLSDMFKKGQLEDVRELMEGKKEEGDGKTDAPMGGTEAKQE